jgi:SAM-dependent MidA family methyltransferase
MAMGDDLTRRLRADIRANGPMRFDAFMEAALYDPAEGYFARDAGGRRGDFATGPHLSPLFGALVARQVEDFWLLLDAPDPFSVIEVGAGDGALAGQVLDMLLAPLRDAVRYTAVDRSPAARAALGRLAGDRPGVSVAERLEDVPPAEAGCLLANELLDNLPFHWIRGTERGPVEPRSTPAVPSSSWSKPGRPSRRSPRSFPRHLRPGRSAPSVWRRSDSSTARERPSGADTCG